MKWSLKLGFMRLNLPLALTPSKWVGINLPGNKMKLSIVRHTAHTTLSYTTAREYRHCHCHCHSRDELFLRSLECYFCVYFPRCFATREINTKITLSWAPKQFVTRVHTLFSISWPNHKQWLILHTFDFMMITKSSQIYVCAVVLGPL